MAISRSFSSSASSCRRCGSFLLLLVVVLNMASIRAAAAWSEFPISLSAYCRSIDECRGGVANVGCCRAINLAIDQGTCSCACRQLKVYGQSRLAAACSKNAACPKCSFCSCDSSLLHRSHIS